MERLVFAALVLAACCPEIDDAIDPPPTADAAIEIIEQLYEAEVGYRVPFEIWWSADLIYLEDSDSYHAGVSWSCSDIRVWLSSDRISETALAHEIAHCYAGDVSQHCALTADNSHSDPIWWGDVGLVVRAKSALSRAGI